MEVLYPETEPSAASLEGTLAHQVAQSMAQGSPPPMGELTEDMLDGAEMYLANIELAKAQHDPKLTVHFETKVRAPNIHPECWGTPDAYLMAGTDLYVWDYKFGHRYVSPERNMQLICYAIAILSNYGTATTDNIRIHLRIVQPRNFHPSGPVREWVCSYEELMRYLPDLQDAARAATGANPHTQVNRECGDCKARHACHTLQQSASRTLDMVGDATPFDLSPQAASTELRRMQDAAEILKARISGLENQVMGQLKGGQVVPGFALQQGMGRTCWAKDTAEVVALGQMMAIDLSKPGLITPKQAIKAGVPKEVVDAYSKTPYGELQLVRDDGSKARSAFKQE